MRFAFVAFLLCSLLAGAGRAAEVEFVRVWPGWRDAESFERIGEFFGRPEKHGREVVLRSRGDDRAGYYFLVRVKSPAAAGAVRFELSVIRPDATEPKIFTFATVLPTKETVFHVGLTGTDWPAGKETHPVAWKLALVQPDGQVLAEHKSFLWENPAR